MIVCSLPALLALGAHMRKGRKLFIISCFSQLKIVGGQIKLPTNTLLIHSLFRCVDEVDALRETFEQSYCARINATSINQCPMSSDISVGWIVLSVLVSLFILSMISYVAVKKMKLYKGFTALNESNLVELQENQ